MLNVILSDLYGADVLKRGKFAPILQRYKSTVQADQDLTAAVRAMIKKISPLVKQRGDQSAFIEKKQLGYLEKLLEKEDG